MKEHYSIGNWVSQRRLNDDHLRPTRTQSLLLSFFWRFGVLAVHSQSLTRTCRALRLSRRVLCVSLRWVEVVDFDVAVRAEARDSGAARHDVVGIHRDFAQAAGGVDDEFGERDA